MKTIPYARQNISQEDIEAVVQVLGSDWLTQGPTVERLEEVLAEHCNAHHAIAVCNGTAALHLACRALDLGPGDLLWTSPNTFVASANCALYCGARVDFVDIDPATYNMSVAALEAKLALAEKSGTIPKILVAVHFAGQPCDMPKIAALARRYGVAVIEDASHAFGAFNGTNPVGSCIYSDVTIFSFHPVKIVTTGEGGALTTNNPIYANRIRLLRSHGITRDPAEMEGLSDGPWYYQQIELGYNYRITDIQAALGLSQLARRNEFIERRRLLAANYDRFLEDMPVIRPYLRPDVRSAWHLYVIRIPSVEHTGRNEVMAGLRNAGIEANVHYIPVHTQPYFARLGFRRGDFPEAEGYYEEALSLPLYFGLADAEQEYVVAQVRRALGKV